MKWHIYPATEMAGFAKQWDALNMQTKNSALLGSHFLLPALEAFGTGNEKLVCLGEPDALDCMAVFFERKRGVWETFQPSQAPLGFWLSRSGLDVSTALQKLARALPGFAVVVAITQQDPVLLPRPADSSRLKTIDYIETARIIIDGSFDAYWEERGKNLRQNMRTARNKLAKAGISARLDCVMDPAAIKKALAKYAELESSGWKEQAGTAIHMDDEQGRFYLNLFETQCQVGHGRIYQLVLNERIAAMDMCVDLGGVIVILKTTYDESMAEYSPAMLMHMDMLREFFSGESINRVEFYGKAVDWYTRLTVDKRMLYHLNAYRWGWVKRLLGH